MEAEGKNVYIYGDNSTGKTTLFNAFTWLLFDKDSQNRKDFALKTLDKENNVIHGLEHTVEAALEVDGRELSLAKAFKEKWTKKRGSATQAFEGHTTQHYIDGVPVKKKEFDEKIASIIDEDVFKLLTSPTYFNEQLKWDKRREILLEVCGDVSFDEVINQDENLQKLPDILGDRDIEEHRKVIAEKKKELNKELDQIPVRISEVENSLPDISDISDPASLDADIEKLYKQVEEKQNEKSRIEAGGEIAEKQKQLSQLESELIEIKNKHREQNDIELEKKREELNSLKDQVNNLSSEINAKQKEVEVNSKQIERLESEMEQLRDQWHEENSKEFNDTDIEDTCYACGQSLPTEKVEDAKQKAKERFNQDKAKKLEEIQQKGKDKKKEKDDLKLANENLNKEIDQLQQDKEHYEAQKQAIDKEVEQIKANVTDISENQEYQAKSKEKNDIEYQIDGLKKDNQDAIEGINQEIEKIKTQVNVLEGAKHRLNQHNKGKKRIEELKEQEKELAKEFEKLEKELHLTEDFIKTKVDLLEDKINSKFKYARFKLFNILVNGGVEPTCETTYQGVPYSSLNHGARINVGLDIINTLSEYYGFTAPVFIDNREAVTELIDIDSQIINLIVSKEDKELRVELEENTEKEVV